MRQQAAANKTELLLLDSGDLIEGTGYSDATPIHGENDRFVLNLAQSRSVHVFPIFFGLTMFAGEDIFPVISKIDYDALTIGNHDIGHPETVDLMMKTFIPQWQG